MKLSVIVPVYNVEKYLDQCVSSVLTLPVELEILLVDDGSKDTSGQLCDDWAEKDSRIRVIHQENGGLSAARNRGIQSSTGDYVMFLDSDDFLDVDEATRLCSYLDGTAQVIVGFYRNYYESENRYEKENAGVFGEFCGNMTSEAFLKQIPADGESFYLTAWRFVVRRDWLQKHELYFYPGIYHEDEEWTTRLLSVADSLTVVNCWFYQYRQARSGSITAAVRPKHVWDVLTILEHDKKLLKLCDEKEVTAEFIKTRMALLFLRGLLYLAVIPKEEQKRAVEVLEKYKALCLPRISGLRGTVARMAVKVFGIRRASGVMQALQTLKNRRKN